MEKQLLEFELDDGSIIVIEAERGDAIEPVARNDGGVRRIAKGDVEAPKVVRKFSEVAASIKPAVEVVLNALKELNTPKEISVEFGLKFSSGTNVILASADGEVTFKVAVKWENKGG